MQCDQTFIPLNIYDLLTATINKQFNFVYTVRIKKNRLQKNFTNANTLLYTNGSLQ